MVKNRQLAQAMHDRGINAAININKLYFQIIFDKQNYFIIKHVFPTDSGIKACRLNLVGEKNETGRGNPGNRLRLY